ncbi:MAG: hypothetical protein RQ751_07140 [Longimicrobiales bacterium]|nr:hypothetical protein [Longimicrobiales bacterium]
MTERRYDETEVARILEGASEAAALPAPREERGAPAAPAAGLTLAELQAIAREVGIDPAAVSRSAAALEVRERSTVQLRRWSGVTLGVSRSVPLPRPLTDEEWGRLVSLLRETFDATGTVWGEGSLREWRNGRLIVAVEEGPDGAMLRLRTRREGWETVPTVGAFGVGMSLVVVLAGLVDGNVGGMLPGAAALAAMGVGAWGYGFVALRGWARERLHQFGRVAEEAVLTAGEPPVGRTG